LWWWTTLLAFTEKARLLDSPERKVSATTEIFMVAFGNAWR